MFPEHISKTIIASYLYFPSKEVNVREIRDEFTVVPKFGEDPISMFHEKEDWIGVPIHAYRVPPANIKEVVDLRISTPPVRWKFTSELWPGQPEVINTFSGLLERGRTGFILEAPPGFGKTVVTIKMLSLLKQRALIVVPRSNLIEQWIERLCTHTTLKREDIGSAEGGHCEFKNKSIVIGLVHTLALDRFGPAFKKAFGVVAFDEVDRSVPPATFAPVIGMFPSKYRIGVSATLKRTDGMDVVFAKHIGECWLRGADENRMKPSVLVIRYPGHSGKLWEGSDVLQRRGRLLSMLAENPERTRLIALFAHKIAKSGRRCLVISDRKEQLKQISEILQQGRVLNKKDIGFYVRSMPGMKINKNYLKQIASDCTVLLATYGMLSIGTDIPDLAGLIYATPQSQVEQTKGRIERFLTGKKNPIIVDIVDTVYNDTIRWYSMREKNYLRSGLKIHRLKEGR